VFSISPTLADFLAATPIKNSGIVGVHCVATPTKKKDDEGMRRDET